MEQLAKLTQSNPRLGHFFTWSGPAFVVLYSAGMLIAGLFPPTRPSSSALDIAEYFAEHHVAISFGAILMCFGAAFIAVWAVAIAIQMRRLEFGGPLLTYAGLGSALFVAIDASLIPTLWAAASFRAGSVPPEITLTLNDIGWFMFLFPWQFGGGVWFVAVGLSILMDKSPQPIYPRWSGWASLWFCFLTGPASLIAFFKTGPFAYNGLIAFYLPLMVLFIWVIVMTQLTFQAYARQAEEISSAR